MRLGRDVITPRTQANSTKANEVSIRAKVPHLPWLCRAEAAAKRRRGGKWLSMYSVDPSVFSLADQRIGKLLALAVPQP